MSSLALTDQQRAALACIRHSIAERGFPPTYDEMMADLGLLSKSSIARLIDALEVRGCIARRKGSARSIILLEDPIISTADAIATVLARCTLSDETARELRGKLGYAA
ncbi:LexA family transcriptional regulator [Pararhodobacter sp. CCB-MM2]|uniref:LexA family protein n=1 Tax=Pararhodobacter sp. CCB-MM2 TaxID=1786003 RepID=UPI000836D2A4|nr:hypothetical protein [Pararhodobacter sp. CCB-MM2]